MNYINQRKLILASSSPRRKQLLEDAGFSIETVSCEFDESFPEKLDKAAIAEYIARTKAKSAKHYLKNDDILITADSIVVIGDRIFGKPVDYNDAYRMLAHLSGKMHEVYTGVCLTDHHQSKSFTSKSTVYFRDFNDAEIRWYIEQYRPYDKAGSYAVQEWVGLCKVSEINGTYTNIMGLPLDLIYEGLKYFENALKPELI